MKEINEKYGVWVSNNVKFDNSYEAYVHATKHSSTVNFYYHHDVFDSFDSSNLGHIDLDFLYRVRAEKLREKYDYLILYYSGGADSHNILRTFIDNNIKLDEICIKWPKALREGKFYNPNTDDTSARNFWSEWDFALKPSLDWISTHHPEIKITFKDFVGDPSKMDINKMFADTAHHQFQTGIILNSLVSDSETALISAGKTVGNIYGLDKPKLATYDNKIFMFFSDNLMRACVRSTINPYGAECFYWTPEMPEIAFEQAYRAAIHYNIHKQDRKFLLVPQKYRKPGFHQTPLEDIASHQQEIIKRYIYTTWDYRFQADKPASASRLDKFFWFYESDELKRQKEIFNDNVTQRLKLIDPIFLSNKEVNSRNETSYTIKTLTSPAYYITDLEDTK